MFTASADHQASQSSAATSEIDYTFWPAGYDPYVRDILPKVFMWRATPDPQKKSPMGKWLKKQLKRRGRR